MAPAELKQRKKPPTVDGEGSSKTGPPPNNRRKGYKPAPSQFPAIPAMITSVILICSGILFAYMLLPTLPKLPKNLHSFPGPKISTTLPQFTKNSFFHRYLWGTYRPGLYFGIRPKMKNTLVFGAMWVDPSRADALDNIRHEALQRDGLAKYGWLVHDGESYGRQEVLDEQFNISTTWIKHNCHSSSDDGDNGSNNKNSKSNGCGPGGDWAARLTATLRTDLPTHLASKPSINPETLNNKTLSFFLYIATEDTSPVALHTPPQHASPSKKPRATFYGSTPSLGGSWQLRVTSTSTSPSSTTTNDDDGNEVQDRYTADPLNLPYVSLHSYGSKTPHLHNITAAVQHGLWLSIYNQHHARVRPLRLILPNLEDTGSNLMVLQVTGQMPLSIDLSFLGGLGDSGGIGEVEKKTRESELSGNKLTKKFEEKEAAFHAKFEKTFGVRGVLQGTSSMAKAALSNLLGGIGYWHGRSLVKVKAGGAMTRNIDSAVLQMDETTLFSAVPSRSAFPRGFLWDEGFHQLLVQRWNPSLSRNIISHWLDAMTVSGWIPREQILGEESRSRVPADFIVQSPDAANPPSLFLPILEMVDSLLLSTKTNKRGITSKTTKNITANIAEDNEIVEFLNAAWPRLLQWYDWFKTSQSGPIPGSFRWRGRDSQSITELNPKTLTSGLDDYPRASHPSSDERHLDLLCWMNMAADVMVKISDILQEYHSSSFTYQLDKESGEVGSFRKEGKVAVKVPSKKVIERLKNDAALYSDFNNLKVLHWDEVKGMFADWGLHTEGVELSKKVNPVNGEESWSRVVTGEAPTLQFIPHCGYVSIFPLLLKAIPPTATDHLNRQLDLLKQLWTPYGLRSLAESSSMYQKHNTPHDPPYWRGTVWANINYLALHALDSYSDNEKVDTKVRQKAGDVAKILKRNILQNLVSQYERTGYLWEQYDDTSGQGKGVNPFTGWTALLAVSVAEQHHPS